MTSPFKKKLPETLDSIIIEQFMTKFGNFKDQKFPPVDRIAEIANFWESQFENLLGLHQKNYENWDDYRKNVQATFCNSRFGSGKTSLGTILINKEYINSKMDDIVAKMEIEDLLEDLEPTLESWHEGKPCILQKLFDNLEECIGEKNKGISKKETLLFALRKIFEKMLGLFFFLYVFLLRNTKQIFFSFTNRS